MDRRSEELLELHEVRQRLASLCATPLGREVALGLAPTPEARLVDVRQAETAEALAMLGLGVAVAQGAADVREATELAARGGTLEVAALGEVMSTVRVAVEAAAAVGSHERIAPRLAERAEGIDVRALSPLADAIDRALDGHGGVRDDSSVELAQARRQLASARSSAVEALRAAADRFRQHLQERFVTERGGRPVLAVKASARGAVPGIVHDRSSSGQTVFVEPLDVVEANNRVRELEALERIEVERVLAGLSADVAAVAPAVGAAAAELAQIDRAMACAMLSRRWDGTAVAASEDVVLLRARHPLLDPAAAVPIDLPLAGVRALVVSGPNAGGKTVALKTLGLLALLHQCGLQPPAAAGRLPVFDRVLADIGDDQSIERNLSTFSGHVRRLIDILAAAGPRTLVLLDEVAAGTDPGEGAAIARAVLEALVAKGALVLATTHHHELKAWASETPRAANAAVGFDADRLAPTFEIRVGEPGASHAIEVAQRLGLDAGVVAAARRTVGEDRGGVEALLQEAAAARALAESERDAALAERDEAARVRVEVEARERELAARVERMRQDAAQARVRARDEARDELAAVTAELTTLRAEIAAARREERRRAEAGAAAARAAERDRRLGAAAAAGVRAAERLAELTAPAGPPRDLAVGDRVVVSDLGVRGEVLSVEGDVVEIRGPSARMRLSASRLVRDGRVAPGPPPPAPPEARPPLVAVDQQLDVRGQRAEAARDAVRAYVDEAAMVGVETVRIVHGRGTGALRAAIGEELARHPLVASFELAGPDEGGDGATIATLR
jgi:DNA mismatch repair protein MutS2